MVSEGRLIKSALGKDWEKLTPSIRARFESDPGQHIYYLGTMREVACSRLGAVIAWITRPLGAPLLPYAGENVRIEVTVSPGAKGSILKRRSYYFMGLPPFTVESRMAYNPKTGFEECVGRHLGMVMRVFSENGRLHFESLYHFVRIGSWQLRLPVALTPGHARILHEDAEGDTFRVRIEMQHPWFSTTFVQDGTFREHPQGFGDR